MPEYKIYAYLRVMLFQKDAETEHVKKIKQIKKEYRDFFPILGIRLHSLSNIFYAHEQRDGVNHAI